MALLSRPPPRYTPNFPAKKTPVDPPYPHFFIHLKKKV